MVLVLGAIQLKALPLPIGLALLFRTPPGRSGSPADGEAAASGHLGVFDPDSAPAGLDSEIDRDVLDLLGRKTFMLLPRLPRIELLDATLEKEVVVGVSLPAD